VSTGGAAVGVEPRRRLLRSVTHLHNWTVLIEQNGQILDIKVIATVVSCSAGCCFVTFYTRRAAMEAQSSLHNIKTLPGVCDSCLQVWWLEILHIEPLASCLPGCCVSSIIVPVSATLISCAVIFSNCLISATTVSLLIICVHCRLSWIVNVAQSYLIKMRT